MPEHLPTTADVPTSPAVPAVPPDVAPLLFADPAPGRTGSGRRSFVQWAVDRYLAGEMRGLEARGWFRLSGAFRQSVDLWSEVVEVELRLLSRRVARMEAEASLVARVRADRAEAARFWQVVEHAWAR
jgi:hypothetical protein